MINIMKLKMEINYFEDKFKSEKLPFLKFHYWKVLQKAYKLLKEYEKK